jgi:hypothetical protein
VCVFTFSSFIFSKENLREIFCPKVGWNIFYILHQTLQVPVQSCFFKNRPQVHKIESWGKFSNEFLRQKSWRLREKIGAKPQWAPGREVGAYASFFKTCLWNRFCLYVAWRFFRCNFFVCFLLFSTKDTKRHETLFSIKTNKIARQRTYMRSRLQIIMRRLSSTKAIFLKIFRKVGTVFCCPKSYATLCTYSLAGFDLTTHSSNLLGGRRRRYHW